jgi:hypothetical protein
MIGSISIRTSELVRVDKLMRSSYLALPGLPNVPFPRVKIREMGCLERNGMFGKPVELMMLVCMNLYFSLFVFFYLFSFLILFIEM